jgi:hypothetical protein
MKMKTWQVVFRNRQKAALVEADDYKEEGDKYVFYPRKPSGDQWFLKDEVAGISVFSEEDADGGCSSAQ